ncbi:MAG: alpha/beta hydrolase [Deltaproteobacteria bacterium]|nr:alpha/beta hydrolase [Deltaproteobacteria bacterium]
MAHHPPQAGATAENGKPQDRWLEVNGLKIHYLEWGKNDKPAMVLLHGFLGHGHAWDDFAHAFSRDYHVLAMDQRGHGRSGWSKAGAYGLEDHFSDLSWFIALLELDNIILIGHSMGGRNALFFTACLPEKVDRLVIVDSRSAAGQRSIQALKSWLVNEGPRTGTFDSLVDGISSAYPNLTRQTCCRIIANGYQEVSERTFIPRYDLQMRRDVVDAGFVVEDLRPYLAGISCPVLVIRGANSPILSESAAREMCRLLPDAKVAEISSASHLPVQENPSAFNRAVKSFLT